MRSSPGPTAASTSAASHYVVTAYLPSPRRAVMTGLTRDGCFLIEKGKITRPVGNMRFTDSLLEGLARCDGRTSRAHPRPDLRGATREPAWCRPSGCEGFRFNGRSQEKPALD